MSIWEEVKNGGAPEGWSWLDSYRIECHPGHEGLLRTADLDTIAGMLRCEEGHLIDPQPNQNKNEVRRLEVEHEGVTYKLFLKRYYNYRLRSIWRRAFRGAIFPPSVVKAEHDNLELLKSWGLHVPESVVYGEHRFAGALINGYLVSLEIPDAMGLDYLIREWLPQQDAALQQETRTILIGHLADAVRIMHENGFEHHDLFFRNIMISGLDFTKLYMMDAPRGRCWPRFVIRRLRVNDLATLDAAAVFMFRNTERLKFMLRYLGRERLSAEDKELIRKILMRSNPQRERQIVRLERAIIIDEEGKAQYVKPNDDSET
jgi:tRNA A-37 threonylcarbamoyl transferase component Bud32